MRKINRGLNTTIHGFFEKQLALHTQRWVAPPPLGSVNVRGSCIHCHTILYKGLEPPQILVSTGGEEKEGCTLKLTPLWLRRNDCE